MQRLHLRPHSCPHIQSERERETERGRGRERDREKETERKRDLRAHNCLQSHSLRHLNSGGNQFNGF